MTNRTAERGTALLMLPPDGVDRLARDRNPAARFAGDLDHASQGTPHTCDGSPARLAGVEKDGWTVLVLEPVQDA